MIRQFLHWLLPGGCYSAGNLESVARRAHDDGMADGFLAGFRWPRKVLMPHEVKSLREKNEILEPLRGPHPPPEGCFGWVGDIALLSRNQREYSACLRYAGWLDKVKLDKDGQPIGPPVDKRPWEKATVIKRAKKGTPDRGAH